MPSKSFQSLQKVHDQLLQRQVTLSEEDKEEFYDAVKEYIAQSKRAGINISPIDEREQLRANLRYWASYYYSVEGQLPDTELAPYNSRKRLYAISLSMMGVIILVTIISGFSLGGFIKFTVYSEAQSTEIAKTKQVLSSEWTAVARVESTEIAKTQQVLSSAWTAIAQTQQVMAWPDTEKIKLWLNSPNDFDNFDSLEGQLVGNYDVAAVVFPNGTFFQIVLNCTCASSSDCCDPERMFLITLMKINQNKNHILAEIPDTVQTMDLVCLNNTAAFAKVSAPWDKVVGFLNGVVSAEELKSTISVQGIP